MNKKLTKLLSVFVIAGAIGTGTALGLAGCGHKHTAADKWESNESQHWHECTANDGAKLDEGAHVDTDNNGKCDTCNYQMSTPAAEYTVTFNANGHGTAPAAATTVNGKVTKPADLSDEDYDFGGWYTDAACTTEFDFNTALTANTTLYAKWTEKAVDLTPVNGVVSISSVKQFLAFRQVVEIPEDVTEYQLTADIDLAGVKLEAPAVVLTAGKTFNGAGYTIKNASYTEAAAKTGILCASVNGGTVTDVKFLGCAVSSANESPAIVAGLVNGTSSLTKIEFNSCTVATTSNYAGLLFARNDVASAEIAIEEITAKNGCITQCAQYGGLLMGDMVATTKVAFKNLDVAGEFKGSSGNGSFIAGRTRGGEVSVENAVISAEMPVANSIGIFSGNGALSKLTVKNVLILKANDPKLYQANKAPTDKIIDGLYAVSGVTVDQASATAGENTVAFLSETLKFDFAKVWKAEGENNAKYRLKAASTNVKSEGATVTEIKVSANNAKARFKKGEEFTAAGLNVMGVYSDGVQLVLKADEGYEVDASAFNKDAAGEYTITVKSKEDATKTATYKVTVAEETGFEINDEFMTRTYLTNGKLDTANLVVKSVWSDGIKEKLKATDYAITDSSYNMAAAGEYNVEITYGNYAAQTVKISVVNTKPAVTEGKVTINVDSASTVANGALVNGVETFKTVVDAIRYLEACNFDKGVVKVVNVAAGTYTAKITTDLSNLTLIGQNTATEDKSILTYSAVESTVDPVSGAQYGLKCATLQVNGENFTAKNITIRNDFDYKNDNKKEASPQGLALTVNGDKAEIVDCHLYGNQDTLYLKNGRAYFKNTLIEGNIDFIFGEAKGIAYFDACTIKAINKSNGQEANNGYVTAMKATDADKPDYGYIFAGCTFTDDGTLLEGSMSLGRPWGAKATVAYINCSFTKAYSKLGYTADDKTKSRWFSMSGNSPVNADFCEYGSTGEGAITEAVDGGKVLTAEQAANYTLANIFAMTNGKCTWTTPWAATNDKVSVTVIDGSATAYAGYVDKNIVINADLAAEWFEVEQKTLVGLYTDEALTTAFDYSTALSASVTLYGKYEDADPTIKESVDYVYSGTAVEKAGKIAFSGMAANGDWLRFGDDNAAITFTAIKGTVINVAVYQGSVLTFNGTEATTDANNVSSYTVTEDGVVTIKRKTNTASYLKTISIIVPISESKTIDLLAYDGGQVQGAVKSWKGITIDATTGKFNNRGNDIQVNTGTVLKFLVADGATIKVVAYNDTDDTSKWTVDVTNGVATLTATANTYIKALEVTVPEKSQTYSYTYGETNGSEWATSATATNTSSDTPAVTGLKVLDTDSFSLTASGKKATITLNGFTTGTSKASAYVTVTFKDASGASLGTLTGTTTADKKVGNFTFTSDGVFESATEFATVEISCNTASKHFSIVSLTISVE